MSRDKCCPQPWRDRALADPERDLTLAFVPYRHEGVARLMGGTFEPKMGGFHFVRRLIRA